MASEVGKLDPSNVYTATTAFLEALYLAEVEVCFVNLGSDHPSFMEAFAIARMGLGHKKGGKLPRIVPVTHEFVALTAAQGYYQATGKPAGYVSPETSAFHTCMLNILLLRVRNQRHSPRRLRPSQCRRSDTQCMASKNTCDRVRWALGCDARGGVERE